MSPISLLILVALAQTPTPTASPALAAFQHDEDYVHNSIQSGDVADALIASSSVLYYWRNTPGFGELIDHVIFRAYRDRQGEELDDEIAWRLAMVEAGAPWEILMETGLATLAAQRIQDASKCFARCLSDETLAGDPYPHLLLGRCRLLLGDTPHAQEAYQVAVSTASMSLYSTFHVRYLWALDLYKAGQFDLRECDQGPVCQTLDSPYAIERMFGIVEVLLYDWSVKDASEVYRLTSLLEETLAETEPRSDSTFEIRRFKEAKQMLERIKAAQNGDDFACFTLDEESCEYDRRVSNWVGVYKRLESWIGAYPISGFMKLDSTEKKDLLLRLHFGYYTALFRAKAYHEAETGFREILKQVPYEEHKDIVGCCYTCLGAALHKQGKFSEAMKVYEDGLSVVPLEDRGYGGILAWQESTRGAMEAEGR